MPNIISTTVDRLVRPVLRCPGYMPNIISTTVDENEDELVSNMAICLI